MKALLLVFFFGLFAKPAFSVDSLSLLSPDKTIRLTVYTRPQLTYSVAKNGVLLMQKSSIDLQLAGRQVLSNDLRLSKALFTSSKETIVSPVPEKRREINNAYSQLSLQFRQPFAVQFRVYNDGVAYRFLTRFKDSITVLNEVAQFALSPGTEVLFANVCKRQDADQYHTSFESLYTTKAIDTLPTTMLAFSPVLVGMEKETKIAITESDLEDYPGMFITKDAGARLKGVFAPYPLEETVQQNGEFLQPVVSKRAAFLAKTKGTRSFPWRVLLIGEDKELPASDLVYRLASPSRIADVSWIRPGQCTDEWIIGINLFGVPFKAGINTATYKYYIDFAKQFGLERIMLDAGWSNYNNLFEVTPTLNMDSLLQYARQKGIDISLWTQSLTLDRQLDSALAQFQRWGVNFIMTDFMDRDDQKMVNFYHRVAKACAEHKIMVMFHGAYPPKGLNRTWPNVLTTEGVLGSEYNIWSSDPTPEHDVTLPFTRMLAGPMDYEPGILDNATKAQFRPIEKKVMSQGTRCHQLAMFVVYDSPLQVFSGNPSQGYQEPSFMQLLGSIPTTWDETIILEAKVADYIITARRKGSDWFVAGMTDWTGRSFTLPLPFLDNGRYEAVLCRDGSNADQAPSDYWLETSLVDKVARQKLTMAPGGGFLLRLRKQN
jgi:alpha-glucosidase